MIRAGATRIGASAGVRIVKESQGVTVSEAAAASTRTKIEELTPSRMTDAKHQCITWSLRLVAK